MNNKESYVIFFINQILQTNLTSKISDEELLQKACQLIQILSPGKIQKISKKNSNFNFQQISAFCINQNIIKKDENFQFTRNEILEIVFRLEKFYNENHPILSKVNQKECWTKISKNILDNFDKVYYEKKKNQNQNQNQNNNNNNEENVDILTQKLFASGFSSFKVLEKTNESPIQGILTINIYDVQVLFSNLTKITFQFNNKSHFEIIEDSSDAEFILLKKNNEVVSRLETESEFYKNVIVKTFRMFQYYCKNFTDGVEINGSIMDFSKEINALAFRCLESQQTNFHIQSTIQFSQPSSGFLYLTKEYFAINFNLGQTLHFNWKTSQNEILVNEKHNMIKITTTNTIGERTKTIIFFLLFTNSVMRDLIFRTLSLVKYQFSKKEAANEEQKAKGNNHNNDIIEAIQNSNDSNQKNNKNINIINNNNGLLLDKYHLKSATQNIAKQFLLQTKKIQRSYSLLNPQEILSKNKPLISNYLTSVMSDYLGCVSFASFNSLNGSTFLIQQKSFVHFEQTAYLCKPYIFHHNNDKPLTFIENQVSNYLQKRFAQFAITDSKFYNMKCLLDISREGIKISILSASTNIRKVAIYNFTEDLKLFLHPEIPKVFMIQINSSVRRLCSSKSRSQTQIIALTFFHFKRKFFRSKIPLKQKKSHLKTIFNSYILSISEKSQKQIPPPIKQITKNYNLNLSQNSKSFFRVSRKFDKDQLFKKTSNEFVFGLLDSLDLFYTTFRIFLLKDYFVVQLSPQNMIIRYYNVYSNLFFPKKNKLFCRFVLDEYLFLNMIFPDMEIREKFINLFQKKRMERIQFLAKPELVHHFRIRALHEIFDGFIILKMDHFIIQSENHMIQQEYSIFNIVEDFSHQKTPNNLKLFFTKSSYIILIFKNPREKLKFTRDFREYLHRALGIAFDSLQEAIFRVHLTQKKTRFSTATVSINQKSIYIVADYIKWIIPFSKIPPNSKCIVSQENQNYLQIPFQTGLEIQMEFLNLEQRNQFKLLFHSKTKRKSLDIEQKKIPFRRKIHKSISESREFQVKIDESSKKELKVSLLRVYNDLIFLLLSEDLRITEIQSTDISIQEGNQKICYISFPSTSENFIIEFVNESIANEFYQFFSLQKKKHLHNKEIYLKKKERNKQDIPKQKEPPKLIIRNNENINLDLEENEENNSNQENPQIIQMDQNLSNQEKPQNISILDDNEYFSHEYLNFVGNQNQNQNQNQNEYEYEYEYEEDEYEEDENENDNNFEIVKEIQKSPIWKVEIINSNFTKISDAQIKIRFGKFFLASIPQKFEDDLKKIKISIHQENKKVIRVSNNFSSIILLFPKSNQVEKFVSFVKQQREYDFDEKIFLNVKKEVYKNVSICDSTMKNVTTSEVVIEKNTIKFQVHEYFLEIPLIYSRFNLFLHKSLLEVVKISFSEALFIFVFPSAKEKDSFISCVISGILFLEMHRWFNNI